MKIKISQIGMVTILAMMAQGSALAEEPKQGYQSTPPKYIETTITPSYFDAKVTELPKLGNDASNLSGLNSETQIQDIGGSSGAISQDQSPELLEIAGKGIVDVSAKFKLPEPAPRDPNACPTSPNGLHGFDKYLAGRIDLVQGHLEVPSIEYRSKVMTISAMPTIDSNSGLVVEFAVLIEDQNGCYYVIRQTDQTATLRLIESLYSANWNPNQRFIFNLDNCRNNWCETFFSGSSYKIP